MPYENIILELEGPIAAIKFNRLKALNALNSATLDELKDAATTVAQAKEIRVVIVTGAGDKAFVAGADIQEMKDMTPVQATAFSHKGHAALGALENMRKPVIAAVNGYALGGGFEVALACDIIYASEKARLGFPEVTLGIFPGFGGTQRTARLIGAAKAKELVLTGKVITAREGFEMGLLNKVTAPDDLMPAVRELAAKMLAAGPIGIGLAKYLVNKSLSLNIESGLELEANTFGLSFGTQDQKEGMTAFLEKRTPTFQGE
ncbi:MAG TPA: enoyl-CoA hydratase-related protein [Syntrophorhabdales bacterium]|nr:enoyl-CoA hydratase-related protein [Syntrophorhabdales bacterium]